MLIFEQFKFNYVRNHTIVITLTRYGIRLTADFHLPGITGSTSAGLVGT